MIVARGKTARKPKRRKYPRAFWIVPVKLRSKLRKHAHVLGQAAIPPCPFGTVYSGKISIGTINFCVYVKEGGAEFLIQC
jgi:hypothetical protein